MPVGDSSKKKDNNSKEASGLLEKAVRAGPPPAVVPKVPLLVTIERLTSEEGRQELDDIKGWLVLFITKCPYGSDFRQWLANQWDSDGTYADNNDAERMMKFLKAEISIIQAACSPKGQDQDQQPDAKKVEEMTSRWETIMNYAKSAENWFISNSSAKSVQSAPSFQPSYGNPTKSESFNKLFDLPKPMADQLNNGGFPEKGLHKIPVQSLSGREIHHHPTPIIRRPSASKT